MQIPRFDITCPRWALPREGIPVHVMMEKGAAAGLRDVEITVPGCLEITDRINITESDGTGRGLVVRGMGRARLSGYDYFGIVVASREPFDELKKVVPMTARFNLLDGTSEERTVRARIFRPRLALGYMPESITLKDGGAGPAEIPVRLEFEGFGEVRIRTECRIGGRIVSSGASVLDRVIGRLAEGGMFLDGNDAKDTSVNPEYVQKMADEIRSKVSTNKDMQRMLQEGRLDGESARLMLSLENDERERLMDVLCQTAEGCLASALSDVLACNIGENMRLDAQTRILAPAGPPAADVEVRFFYRDLLDNAYPPVGGRIRILDGRRNGGGTGAGIPLRITGTESGAYRNVGGTDVGSGS